MTENSEFRAERFRFVNLILFMLAGIQTQMMWVTFAPAIDYFASFYGVSPSMIVVLGALFLIMYIPMNYPATHYIDAYGLKKGVGIGVYLTGLDALVRALGGSFYPICFIGQIMAAIGQPYVLNCWSKLGTDWFLEEEKATSVGLGELSIFVGIIIAMIFLIEELGAIFTLWFYAITGLTVSFLYAVFARDKPAEPPNVYAIKEVKISGTRGIKTILTENREFLKLFIVIFIGLGIFNAITTEIDGIFGSGRYLGVDSGTVSAFMIIGGILGSIILSPISDRTGKRKIFLVIAIFGGTILSVLMYFIREPTGIYTLSFIYGFVLVACLPIGLTYAAEITYPYPEQTSAGVLMTGGQISGILFLLYPTETYMLWSTVTFGIGFIVSLFLHDPKVHPHSDIRKIEATPNKDDRVSTAD